VQKSTRFIALICHNDDYSWRKVEGVMSDRRIPPLRKTNGLSSCVTPAYTGDYGIHSETTGLRKQPGKENHGC